MLDIFVTRKFNGDLLSILQANCMMSTEEDVQMALKVSNALTKAILEYRLHHLQAYVSATSWSPTVMVSSMKS